MSSDTKAPRNNVIPSLRYQRAAEAIEWLCRVFGFEKHAVYEGEKGSIEHAQLTLGGGMLMLASIRESPFSQYTVQPGEIGGRETQTQYLVADDVRRIYNRAKEADAEILLDLRTEDYGGEHFTCRDPEGHIWNIGSYDPWRT